MVSSKALEISLGLFLIIGCVPSDLTQSPSPSNPSVESPPEVPRLSYKLIFVSSAGQCSSPYAKNSMLNGDITVAGGDYSSGSFNSFSLTGTECRNALDRSYNPWPLSSAAGDVNQSRALTDAQNSEHGCAWTDATIKTEFKFPCGGQIDWELNESSRTALALYYKDTIPIGMDGFSTKTTENALSCQVQITWSKGTPARLSLMQVYEYYSKANIAGATPTYSKATCTHNWQIK